MRKDTHNKLGNLPEDPGTDEPAIGNNPDPNRDVPEPTGDPEQDHPEPTAGQAEAFRRFRQTRPDKLGRRMAERGRRRTKNRVAKQSRKKNR